MKSTFTLITILTSIVATVQSFTPCPPTPRARTCRTSNTIRISSNISIRTGRTTFPTNKPCSFPFQMSNNDDVSNSVTNGVLELADDDEFVAPASASASASASTSAAPFLSQGDIQKEALELSNDPKQTRVIIYIVLSLLPVLFLVPLMLGSRDLIPLDALPPVDMN